jgi:hypothetical protein
MNSDCFNCFCTLAAYGVCWKHSYIEVPWLKVSCQQPSWFPNCRTQRHGNSNKLLNRSASIIIRSCDRLTSWRSTGTDPR